jgi:carbon monoxide dehydrogenase subunit G
MKLENTFTVPVPVAQAWEVLLDLHRVAPCMPGATLTGVEGDEFTGNVKVKLGPIMLTYSGKGRFVERDEAAHRVVIEASGRDTRSAGTAAATVTATLADDGGARTRVDVVTDLSITGKPAQFGRSMISDVSAKLLGQFADCLAGKLAESGAAVPADAPAPVVEPAPSAAEAAAPAATSAAVEAPAPTSYGPDYQTEPIDLLRVTGGTAAARRTAVGLGAVLLAVLAWVLVRTLRRR